MSNSVNATDYSRIPKAQLIEKMRYLEREFERLVQNGSGAAPKNGMSNDGEERFRDFAEIASDWFWETDEHLRFTYFSGRHDDIGLEIEKTLGKTRPEVTIEDTSQKKWSNHLADLAVRKPFTDFQYASHARDGRVIQLAVSGKAIFDEAGNFKGYRGTGTDITALVKVENELQYSEERFKDIAEASGDWFWETDAHHRYTWLSDRVEETTGVPARIHTGKSRLDLVADRVERKQWRAHLETLKARRPFRNFRYLQRDHVGRLQHISSSGAPVFDAKGEFTGYRGTGTDITAEVTAEETAASVQKRFMAAIEVVADGFALFDADDRMVFCNRRFKELNPDLAPKIVPGISFEDMLRENIAANRILDALGDEEAFIRERMERHRNPRGPLVQQRRDGRWLELREDRTPDGSTFLVNTDITERKKTEVALKKARDELELRVDERTAELRAAQAILLRQERLTTLGELTATVSHELRNPLGTIRTSVAVLRRSLKEIEPIVQRSLERIERSTVRCAGIIDELLDFTRISVLEPELVPVDAWLEETLNEQILSPEITLHRDFGLGDMTAPFDRDRFRRAIVNVFDNACQAMIGEGNEDTGAGECVLTVRTQNRNGCVEVVFEDTGPGMPPDVHANIFEPLFSTKSFGVGLGLPVVKRIMEQHGGGLEIETEEGRGTRVCLRLPHGHSSP